MTITSNLIYFKHFEDFPTFIPKAFTSGKKLLSVIGIIAAKAFSKWIPKSIGWILENIMEIGTGEAFGKNFDAYLH
ncbi:hypothetical protein I79_014569 [Cricetulus griseus]|uniref:Uncharacterized protein n=1 Tax=Cricetulus griseus TaxID=10029 RepID=G3HUF9_CRIGR|nr:hypothetical protein I79_014569 [Cricetulus griseus]